MEWVGIDVSKDTLDCGWFLKNKYQHFQTTNDSKGYQQILTTCPKRFHYIMEATGVYYVHAAKYLTLKSRHVTVINPLQFSHYRKAELRKTKTDKSDSLALSRFGKEKNPHDWFDPPEHLLHLRQILSNENLIHKQLTQLTNHLHAQQQLVGLTQIDLQPMLLMKHNLEYALQILLISKMKIVNAHYARQLECIQSIPGIGAPSAIRFISVVGDISRFSNNRQLTSFLGIAPTISQSGIGNVVHGPINHTGNHLLMRDLYFCAMSASRNNAQCRRMWKRMVRKHKPGKLILIAIAHKLVHQIFALLTQDTLYDPKR